MGLAFAGGSIGNIFLQQLTAFSLQNYGASKSYLFFGILSLVVGIPITLFLRIPKNSSEIVKGKKKENEAESKSTNDSEVDWGYTLNEAKSLKFFWIFALGLFFLGMYVSALAVQYPAYLKLHLKLDPMIVCMVGSIFALCSLGGNLFGGIIFDKLGVTKGLIVAAILAATSCLALIFSGQMPILAQGFAAGSSVFALLVDKAGYSVAWTTILVFIGICYGSLVAASIGMNKLNKKEYQI